MPPELAEPRLRSTITKQETHEKHPLKALYEAQREQLNIYPRLPRNVVMAVNLHSSVTKDAIRSIASSVAGGKLFRVELEYDRFGLPQSALLEFQTEGDAQEMV